MPVAVKNTLVRNSVNRLRANATLLPDPKVSDGSMTFYCVNLSEKSGYLSNLPVVFCASDGCSIPAIRRPGMAQS